MTALPTPPVAEAVADAYRDCEQTTRREAANFYYGIRLLPSEKRRAMSAVYAFARRVDDIGDGSLPTAEKVALLARERDGIARLRSGIPGDDAVIVALADASARFDLPLDAFDALIDGVEQDVRGDRFATFDDLVLYCERVAGSIGRLCVAIFGARDLPAALVHADELGVAMQLTNILRDVREDHENGRLYLPQEDLVRFGCGDEPLGAPPAALEQLIRFEAARNREWFARGLRLLPLLDRRSAACVLAMTGIYRRILDRIEEDPLELTRHRISLPIWEKAALAVRSLAGVGGQ
ncbi:MAG: squalene synthase HpnD [Conexibacter sp.]|nr:squalene synthase HpnD [Conexibacter sp.]